MSADSRPPLLVVCGPTASGKTALGVQLARRFGGEVLNADSRQVVRGMDVGTGKPTEAERGGVAHHLFDLVEPGELFSAAAFRAAALDRAAEVTARGRLPIVVGGSGLYLRALRDGLFEGPERSHDHHPRLTAIAEAGGLTRLWRWLARVDPAWAAQVGPGDRQRIVRGLDVYLQTGRPISDHIRGGGDGRCPYDVLAIAIEWPREQLYARIEDRLREMVDGGFADEVRRLLRQSGFRTSNAAKAVGYRDMVEHVEGRLDVAEVVERVGRDTRRLAKRQLTWFRGDEELAWIPSDGRQDRAEALVAGWLRPAAALGGGVPARVFEGC